MAGKKRRSGRKKSKKYLPFEQAKFVMREEQIQSKAQFFKWKKLTQNETIPLQPQQVYRDEWISFNDFFGTNNKFPTKKQWWEFDRCWKWALECPATNKEEWSALNIPDKIPRRPDITFRGEFTGWNTWLGVSKKPKNVVAAAQAMERMKKVNDKVLYIALDNFTGTYICEIVSTIEEAKKRCSAYNVEPRVAFSVNDNQWKNTMLTYGRHIEGSEWSIDDYYGLLFEMNSIYEKI